MVFSDAYNSISDCKGIFVMYNCARIAALFKSFEQAVEIGTVKSLHFIG